MRKNYLRSLLILLLVIPAAASASVPGYPEEPVSDTLSINPVVVTGTRVSVTTNNLPMSVSVVTESQLEARQEQSVMPILAERVPGFMITSRGVMGYGSSSGAAGAMTMRGVGSGMLILIDGHPQFMGIFSHPLTDTYQTLMAERVEVVRGPASVLYGQNAMGGVINILTRRQHTDGVDTRVRAMYGSYNTLSTEAINKTRFGRFHSVASFGYNRSDGHRRNMDYEQYSGYAKIGYDFSDNWKGFADLNLSQSYSSNPGSVERPMFDNDMDIFRGITSLSLTNLYQRTSGALKIFYNFGDHYIDDGYAEGGQSRQNRFNSTDWMFGVTAFQNYSLWHGNQTTLGFDFQRYGGHAWTSYLNGDPDRDISKEYMSDLAGYMNFQQLLWDKLMLNAGIRFDHHSVTGGEWVPQAGISWSADPNTTVKGIVSKGYRNPTMRELYMWAPANPDLEPESLMNYEISVSRYLLDSRLALELSAYYIKGKNSIVSAPYIDDEGNERFRWNNSGDLENYGIELTVDYRLGTNLSLNANYSYLHMEHEIAGAPQHKLYAGADYTLKKWTFSTGIQYVHGMVTQAPDPGSNPEVPGEKDSFLLWNARVSFKAAEWFDLFARAENLLDRDYETYKGYPMPGTTVFGGVSVKF